MWFFLAIPMTFSLVARSKVRIPRGFGLFMLFFIWMLATVIQLQGNGDGPLFGFAYRAGLYYSAGVWCLYIYNAPKRLLPTRTILKVADLHVDRGRGRRLARHRSAPPWSSPPWPRRSCRRASRTTSSSTP